MWSDAVAGGSSVGSRGGKTRSAQWWTVSEPRTLVLYRTAQSWRWALYFVSGQIADGYLSAPSPDSSAQEARDALVLRAGELTRRDITVRWRPGDEAGWWTGEVDRSNGAAAPAGK